MPTRSIVDIDLNDAKFQRFARLFGQYQEALTKTPGAWGNVSRALGEHGKQFERIGAVMAAQRQIDKEDLKDTEKLATRLEVVERLWKKIEHQTGSVAHNIKSATVGLLRWGALITGTTGILGIGGLFGLDRMARQVGGARQQAKGLGMSIGQVQAFGTDFGRFVNPDAFLSNVNQMEVTPKEWSVFSRLGVAPTGKTFQDAMELLNAARQRALETPLNQLGLLSQQTGLNLSPQEWRLLRNTTNAEWFAQMAHARQDERSFSTDDATNRKWQDLATQFERAAHTVFDAFQKRIGELTPEITKLSGAFTHLAVRIINSPLAKEAIDKLGVGLGDLEKWLGSKSFESDLQHWKKGVKEVGAAILTFGADLKRDLPGIEHTLGIIAHPFQQAGKTLAPSVHAAEQNFGPATRAVASAATTVGVPIAHYTGGFLAWLSSIFPHPSDAVRAQRRMRAQLARMPDPWNKSSALQRLSLLDKRAGLAPGTMEYLWKREASDRFNPPDSQAGAEGPFQLMPDIARRLGIDPRDFGQSSTAAAYLFAQELREFHGNIKKALAAYNWGAGNLERDIAAHGKDWFAHTPKETQAYVRGAASLYSPPPPIKLDIHTTPGADVMVASAQLAGAH